MQNTKGLNAGENIESSNEASCFSKILTKEQTVSSFSKRSDGSWIESKREILDTIMDIHFHDSVRKDDFGEPLGHNILCQREEVIIGHKIITGQLNLLTHYTFSFKLGYIP